MVRAACYAEDMIPLSDICDDEWAEWYLLSPRERWAKSQALWAAFLMLEGSLDAEPDTQSPFYDPDLPGARAPDGRPGVRVLRRSRV